ncbi:hypothetical protein HaLaN_15740 [Haematococcus lacustris]|uniref:Uncharacterized protein n=1 Tax=Haematococcus lacustris TaxID=44745 RepID=A0A699ZBS9_HAELA|nr:hypothetical protein HaLaN_15740 [Haematococcus lacustris]
MAASAASDDAVGRHRIKPPNRRQHRLEVDHIDEESGAWSHLRYNVELGALNEASSAVSGVASVATGLYQAAGVAAELLQGNPVVLNGQKELDLLAMNWDTRSRSVQSPVLPLMNSGGLQIATITFPVAFIPVHISFAVGLQAKLTVRTAVPGTLSLGFDYTRSVTMGVEYRSQWEEMRR